MNTDQAKEITLDDLAVMVNKGFKESRAELNEFKVEVRKEFSEFRAEVKAEFVGVHEDIADLREDLDDLRKTVVLDHGRRLRKIEHKFQIA